MPFASAQKPFALLKEDKKIAKKLIQFNDMTIAFTKTECYNYHKLKNKSCDEDGVKLIFQRVGGWCEPTDGKECITRCGVAVLNRN